jgi:phosphoglycolate phosphatase-like HAD superfamily hydrolase
MYKEILWDLDGTLLDTYPNMINAFCNTLKEYGIEESYDNVFDKFRISLSNAVDFFTNKYNLDDKSSFKSKYKFNEKASGMDNIKPFDNIIDICKKNQLAGKRNYLLTHRGKSSIKFLKYFDMYKYFTDFVTGMNKFPRKPAPDGVNYLVEKYNFNLSEVIVIGDRELDMDAAKNAGVKSCFFDTNSFNKRDVSDYYIKEANELYEILGI